jgi:redox-sensitive bicupin YhaK (pirin superfamily)
MSQDLASPSHASDRSSAVREVVPLGMQWPTVDPFLFCVHHLDHYPAANDQQGPAASLAGRPLGQDFEGIDGWRMYHGQVVPGFPAHPHRGFETVTYVRQGLVDHSDSLGAAARYGRGDVQWMTAGSGIVHSEMFPLLDRDGDNTLELFQIWINLPASDKMVDPHFSMFWDGDVPRHREPGVTVTVLAGTLGDAVPPSPPPASWASRTDADVAIWHIVLDDHADAGHAGASGAGADGTVTAGSSWTIPAATGDETQRVLYVFGGEGVDIDGTVVDASTAVVVDASVDVPVRASAGAEILMLQGRPLAEPVAQYGPFVMNTRAEIQQAFEDYQRTQFGGWPWDRDDPVHGLDGSRFARRPNGDTERPS